MDKVIKSIRSTDRTPDTHVVLTPTQWVNFTSKGMSVSITNSVTS